MNAAVDEREALAALQTLLAFLSHAMTTSPPIDASFYSSARRGPHPAGKSARWCRDHFKTIPGARRVGRDWTISATAFDAWTTAQTRERRMRSVAKLSPRPIDVELEAAEALKAHGVRLTRKAVG